MSEAGTVQRVKREMVGWDGGGGLTTVEDQRLEPIQKRRSRRPGKRLPIGCRGVVHVISEGPLAWFGRTRSADLASGAKCILRHLDPVRL